jgi:hypothetical protein
MAENPDAKYMHALVTFIEAQLHDEETIIQIKQGMIDYGRQTYLNYLINVATLPQRTGNDPVAIRQFVVAINVDTPESPQIVPRDRWRPFVSVYSD